MFSGSGNGSLYEAGRAVELVIFAIFLAGVLYFLMISDKKSHDDIGHSNSEKKSGRSEMDLTPEEAKQLHELREKLSFKKIGLENGERILLGKDPGSRDNALERIARYHKQVREVEAEIDALLSHSRRRRVLKSKSGKDAIYCLYTFDHGEDIYIGLTKTPKARARQHLLNSHNAGVRKMVERGANFSVFASSLTAHDAANAERDLIAAMKKTGKRVHNLNSGGGLGGVS